jgi:SIR2-like domain
VRFLAGGPSIPDQLLVARDEGRVIFFCGAGVSRARAGLADFFGLAKQVLDALETGDETPTRKLFEAAKRVEADTGISGLVPADRIFGLLEREFKARDIQESVARALKPSESVDLSAHRTLLQLASGPDGKVRLVTTNFDLLFEAAASNINSFSPPHIPDPRRHDDLEGVTHLHGKVTPDYSGATDDRFVLSSSEFGHAYVSEGWATKFIASLLERYVVVFVGYTADDPPVQYLLEALNRDTGSSGSLYAFQAGPSADADSRWRHRGVEPIPYDPSDHHKALWDTLAAWAIRAQDPEAWQINLIHNAHGGPEAMSPHERGQIVHLVETVEGARRFASAERLPPAEWLCVFDPSVRYSMPRRLKDVVNGEIIDPFELYGLDSDPRPAPVDADDFRARRAAPGAAKNPLLLTRLDQTDLGPNEMPALSGHWALNVPMLTDRLRHLSAWISKVAYQPATVWWATGKRGLHPDIQQMIQFQLRNKDTPSTPEVRRAWQLMSEAWATRHDEANGPWFELKAQIARDGWSPAAARQLALVHRAYLAVQRPFSGSPKPPGLDNPMLGDMLVLDVEYPHLDIDVEIPNSMISAVTREFRRNVEHAVALELETGGYALSQIAPIQADPGLEAASLHITVDHERGFQRNVNAYSSGT